MVEKDLRKRKMREEWLDGGKYVLRMELFAESHRCNTLGLRRALISPALPSVHAQKPWQ